MGGFSHYAVALQRGRRYCVVVYQFLAVCFVCADLKKAGLPLTNFLYFQALAAALLRFFFFLSSLKWDEKQISVLAHSVYRFPLPLFYLCNNIINVHLYSKKGSPGC